jgi:hypothetical protein
VSRHRLVSCFLRGLRGQSFDLWHKTKILNRQGREGNAAKDAKGFGLSDAEKPDGAGIGHGMTRSVGDLEHAVK